MGIGSVTGVGARAGLYAAALAVFIGSSVVGSGSETNEPVPPQGASADSGKEVAVPDTPDAVDPFLQDEVTFHFLPDAWQLLIGREGDATARTLMVAGCGVSNRDLDDEADLPAVVMVPSNTTGLVDGLGLPVDLIEKESRQEQVCAPRIVPVDLSVDMRVSEPARGWLVAVPTVPGTLTPDTASVPYVVKRIIHPWGYGLLAITAGLVALLGVFRGNPTEYAEGREKELAGEQDDKAIPSLPVMASIYGALALATAGLSTWTDLVPGLDLGGVLVVGLIAAVLVAAGDRLVATYQRAKAENQSRRANAGLFLSLFGAATMALLIPFVLLHGANIGVGSAAVWGLATLFLIFASLFRLPQGATERAAPEYDL